MTPAEIAKVLATAATFDPRLKPPSAEDAQARVAAWSLALDPDMVSTWAQKAVVAHYATSDKALLPAHLNDHWARYVAHRAAELRQEEARRDRYYAEQVAVPMPPEVRASLREISQ